MTIDCTVTVTVLSPSETHGSNGHRGNLAAMTLANSVNGDTRLPAAVKRETKVSCGAAALLDGLFEHPSGGFSRGATHADHGSSRVPK